MVSQHRLFVNHKLLIVEYVLPILYSKRSNATRCSVASDSLRSPVRSFHLTSFTTIPKNTMVHHRFTIINNVTSMAQALYIKDTPIYNLDVAHQQAAC